MRRVAHDLPATRAVFVRYGEETDRPVFGHLETLARFAERHACDLDHLLTELATAAGVTINRDAGRAEGSHRPFVVTALIVTLTLGAGWGSYLLATIGARGTLVAASPSDVIVHGAAQLWGFVAMFIVGISLRYLPVTVGRTIPPIGVRRVLIATLALGVFTGVSWGLAPRALHALGPASGVALMAGAITYLVFVVRATRGKLSQVWLRFVLMTALWMVVWAIWTFVLQTRNRVVGPSGYSPVDRQIIMDVALFGFVVGSVYGFGQKLLPGLLGTGKGGGRWFDATFFVHGIGVVVLVIGRVLDAAVAICVGTSLIAVGAFLFVVALGGLRGRTTSTLPEKGHPFLRRYIQLAFVWLVISTTGIAAVALLETAGVVVPHAIHGALRHALTVGFVVTLIMGVAQRLLPILGHARLAWPRLVLPIFILIAVGNMLRVACEALAPWWSPAFRIMPVSGLVELTALVLFAANVVRTMWPAADSVLNGAPVSRNSRMVDVLSCYPWIEDDLIEWGMEYVTRVRQVPTELTVGTFAVTAGYNADETVARINDLIREPRRAHT